MQCAVVLALPADVVRIIDLAVSRHFDCGGCCVVCDTCALMLLIFLVNVGNKRTDNEVNTDCCRNVKR